MGYVYCIGMYTGMTKVTGMTKKNDRFDCNEMQ
jgi:hypothetical protein